MNDEPNPPERRKKRVRLSAALLLSALATAAIGFGGLAAWTVTTQNNGSTFTTGTVHHSNLAKVGGIGAGVSCTDQAGVCGIIFTSPGNSKPGDSTTGTVQIINTGSLTSTFSLSEVSAVTTGAGATLCHDLTLNILDNEGGGPAVVYNGALDGIGTPGLLQTAGSTNWANGDTGTYTFTITLAGSTPTDMGSTCTAAFRWSQTNT